MKAVYFFSVFSIIMYVLYLKLSFLVHILINAGIV